MPRIIIVSNARSGSTYLRELLNCHPEIHIDHELLNDEVPIKGDPLEHLETQLALHPQNFVGFKVFPEQVFHRDLNFTNLVRHIGATFVIVLWREGVLETLASRRIAETTGVWYTIAPTKTTSTIEVQQDDLKDYFTKTIGEWEKIGDQWPQGVQPIFVKFEDLLANPMEQVRLILSRLALPADNFSLGTPSTRQNPSNLPKKVTNFYELPEELRNSKLEVFKILGSKINCDLQLPQEVLPFAPNKEPCIPPGGWRYRVAQPFMPVGLKQNVYDAVESGSISSAGYWPRLMSSKLKKLFQVPVAQPCSNGFTALMLALQSANVGKGDEVIMPSMTMVAVPNSAYFVGAKPIFPDCAEGDYNPGLKEILQVATDKTKAIIVTHTYGVPTPEMEKITEECHKRGWWLIEDISECVGVKVKISDADGSDKLLGTFGHFACASMYVNKMIHAGDGGFVIAKDPTFAIRLTSIVNHGFTPSYHFVHFEPALNAKINGLGAAMACGCIDQIQFVMDHRAKISRLYRNNLKDLPINLMPQCGPYDTPWVFGFQCQSKMQRTELRLFLAERGIETRDFFFALHLEPAYYKDDEGQIQPRLPLCETLGSTGFYLPTHSNLTEEDVNFISSCINQFFNRSKITENPIPPQLKSNLAVQVQPGSFNVEIRAFNESGTLKYLESRGHIYIEAVKLGLEAEEVIVHERWDQKTLLVQRMEECIDTAREEGLLGDMVKYFEPYISYFKSQAAFEPPTVKPWIHIDLNSKHLKEAENIPTTSDPETLKLLIWLLRETRAENIWEIGSWMGYSTFLMAAEGQDLGIKQRIFACDAFRWQEWMNRFVPGGMVMQEMESFLKLFNKYTEKYSEAIQPVNWPYDISELPEVLVNQRPDLVYLDITQEDEDLEVIWTMIKPNLIQDKSIILFNGLSYSSIQFFARHADELVAVAKPHTIAKVFKFVSPKEPEVVEEVQDEEVPLDILTLGKKLNFQSDPGWTHHHKNLFCSSVALLKEKFHDPNAPIMFFPAVEEKMCDEPEKFLNNLWIGIAHAVVDYPELFYTPDLRRLCSPKFSKMMRNCKGLFTLTEFQAEYLKENLPKEYTFPVQLLKYPVQEDEACEPSKVPELWGQSDVDNKVDLVLIGSFARDFKLFFETPIPKNLQKVMVTGDEVSEAAAKKAPSDVKVLGRLGAEEYEKTLRDSIVFLSLKYDGAANTLILECIARNVPIVAPKLKSCSEYLGDHYPLLYDPVEPKLEDVITLENIQRAISHLKTMDKTPLSLGRFTNCFEKGAVMVSVPPMPSKEVGLTTSGGVTRFSKFDVTLCICSYKRTHHLKQILESLWSGQDFQGTFQIIVWNNNEARGGIVRDICGKYIQQSNDKKSLEMINSSENYFCSVRFAMPALMKSDCLLICDDDIIPGRNFVSFFTSANRRHPEDVLCVRGHVFLPHELDLNDPANFWYEYDALRFKGDEAPEQFIHFVHADACLIPRKALREIASVDMPDASFTLVDDYWMSFILNHRFGRKLRKLSVKGLDMSPINRTDDSDQVGLALHTRPEVQDARIRLYVHHMNQQWPKWTEERARVVLNEEEKKALRKVKSGFWDNPQLGFNISSKIKPEDVKDLRRMGVNAVRIGAVGVGGETEFDLCGFLKDPEGQIRRLKETVDLLAKNGINLVLALDRRLFSGETWKLIAGEFDSYGNVVGYDLINEPVTEGEKEMHWADLEEGDKDVQGVSNILKTYTELIKSIREVDQVTPIIIEPTFWGRIFSIKKLPIEELKKIDDNLIVSFHFYEPMSYTQRGRNKGRYSFPCRVPLYDDIPFSEEIDVNEDFIKHKFQGAKKWSDEHGVRIFVGELGICRDVQGAEVYLKAVIEACKKSGFSGFLFSFRDDEWEAMDYELGSELFMLNCPKVGHWEGNKLMEVVTEGVRSFKN